MIGWSLLDRGHALDEGEGRPPPISQLQFSLGLGTEFVQFARRDERQQARLERTAAQSHLPDVFEDEVARLSEDLGKDASKLVDADYARSPAEGQKDGLWRYDADSCTRIRDRTSTSRW